LLVRNTVFENVRPLLPSDHAGVIGTVDVIGTVAVPEPPVVVLVPSALFLFAPLKLRNR
jgi:hypothetical protein